MGINGGSWAAVTVPKWLLVLVTFCVGLAGLGASLGVRWATATAQIDAMQRTDQQINVRVDTLQMDVDAIKRGRSEDAQILRALATLRCLDGTPLQLTRAAGVPCADLVGNR